MADNPWEDYSQSEPWADYAAPQPAQRSTPWLDKLSASQAQPTGNFFQNILPGVGKMYTDVGLGAKQLWAQLTGADPSKVTAPFIGETAQQKRVSDAPLQNTVGGKVGEVAGALPLAFLPGANTFAGAGLMGGAIGATQPTVGDESRLLNTGVGAASGLLGKYAGDKLTGWITGRAAEPFMGWNPATATQTAAEAVGSSSPKLTQPAIAEANTRLGGIFNQARSPNVSLVPGAQTLSTVDNLGIALNSSTRKAFENNDNVSDLLDFALNNKPATAQQLGQISSKLGADARSEMTSKNGDRALGQALFKLQDHADDLVGSTISDPNLAQAYGTARSQYRALTQLTSSPSILNSASGDVNMTALGKFLQRTDKPGYLRGGNQSPLYNAARWGQATGEGPGAPPMRLGSDLGLPLLKYYGLNNPVSRALGGATSRSLKPVAPRVSAGTQGLMMGLPPALLPYFEK